jgi:hypothetical protein
MNNINANFYDNKWTLAFTSVGWGTSTLLCPGTYNAVKTALIQTVNQSYILSDIVRPTSIVYNSMYIL